MEFVFRVLDFLKDKLSLRKIMLWLFFILAAWTFTPQLIKNCFYQNNLPYLHNGSSFLIACIVISFFLTEFIFLIISASSSFVYRIKKNREEEEDWDIMRNLSKPEVEIVFHIIYSGKGGEYLNMSDMNVISLLEKGVLKKRHAFGGSPIFYLNDGLEEIAISLMHQAEMQRVKSGELADNM